MTSPRQLVYCFLVSSEPEFEYLDEGLVIPWYFCATTIVSKVCPKRRKNPSYSPNLQPKTLTLFFLSFFLSRRSNSRSAMLSSSQKKEMKLAVMLMIVVLVFLICNVLSLVVNILEVFEISYKPLTEISNLGRQKLDFLR